MQPHTGWSMLTMLMNTLDVEMAAGTDESQENMDADGKYSFP